jgi:hypothetical protein
MGALSGKSMTRSDALEMVKRRDTKVFNPVKGGKLTHNLSTTSNEASGTSE